MIDVSEWFPVDAIYQLLGGAAVWFGINYAMLAPDGKLRADNRTPDELSFEIEPQKQLDHFTRSTLKCFDRLTGLHSIISTISPELTELNSS